VVVDGSATAAAGSGAVFGGFESEDGVEYDAVCVERNQSKRVKEEETGVVCGKEDIVDADGFVAATEVDVRSRIRLFTADVWVSSSHSSPFSGTNRNREYPSFFAPPISACEQNVFG
jgi:hypothetical protein